MDMAEKDITIRRVIVIDDNPDIHKDFKMIFEDDKIDSSEVDAFEAKILGEPEEQPCVSTEKYELDFAFQGEEGVEKIKAAVAKGEPYELAFVDMRMPPGWDGLVTIEHIWDVDPCVQVVVCSAYSDYSWDEVIHRLGHKDSLLILRKPLDSTEISQLACALTEKYILSKSVSDGSDHLAKIIQEKVVELQLARADAEEAESVLTSILSDEGVSEEIKSQIKAICKNSSRLLEAITKVLENSGSPS